MSEYGYRLPEDDSCLLYYQVYFKMVGEFLFTYPHICIRSRETFTFPRADPAPILTAFLADLSVRLPSVCGHPLRAEKHPAYMTPELLPSETVDDGKYSTGLPGANLTTSVPSRGFSSYRPAVCSHPRPTPQSNVSRPENYAPIPPGRPRGGSLNDSTSHRGIVHPQASRPLGSSSGGDRFGSTTSVGSTGVLQTSRVVPTFKQNAPHRPAPKLDKAPTSFSSQTHRILNASIPDIPEAQTPPHFAPHLITSATVPKFMPHPHPITSTMAPRFASHPTPMTAPRFTQRPTASMIASHLTPRPAGSSSVGQYQGFSGISSQHPAPRHLLQATAPTYPPMNHDIIAPSQSQSVNRNLNADGKPKKRTKVQKNVDVEELVRNGQLAKANAVTLLAWLRSRGAPCKAKDKKGELMEKVTQLLRPAC